LDTGSHLSLSGRKGFNGGQRWEKKRGKSRGGEDLKLEKSQTPKKGKACELLTDRGGGEVEQKRQAIIKHATSLLGGSKNRETCFRAPGKPDRALGRKRILTSERGGLK